MAGTAGVLDRLGQPVGAALALEVAGLDQLPDDLLDEERVAAGALVDQLGEPVERGIAAGQIGQQLPGRVRSERHQRHPPVDRRVRPRGLVLRPEVDHRQGRRSLHRADHLRQERLAALVHPVQVLDHVDDHLGAPGDPVQAPDHAAKQPLPRLGAHLRRRALRIGHGEEVEDERQVVREVGIEQQQPAGDLLARDPLGVAVLDPEVPAQHLQHRQERDRLAVRLTLGLVDLDPARPASLRELVAEAALADARLGDHADHRPTPLLGPLERLLEDLHLLGSADEPGEPTLSREVEPRARRARPDQLEDLDRAARALDLELAEVLQLEVALGELRRVLGEVGLAGLRERLHALRQADRVADGGVLGLVVLADRAGDHLARVDPDPDREAEPLGAAKLARVLGDELADVKSREAGPRGVVLVRDRRPEQRHDPVARELVHGALEAPDALGEQREEALHDLTPLLGVGLLGHVHRAHDVGEQDGHLLALAVERRRFVFGSRDGRRCLPELLPAGVAEALAGGILGAAARTRLRPLEARTAGPAESRVGRVRGAAATARR